MKAWLLSWKCGYLRAQHYLLSHTGCDEASLEQARRAAADASRELAILSIQ